MKKPIPDARLKEGDVAPEIAHAFATTGARLFRNNCGVAKYGKSWVRYGIREKGKKGGGSDHIGYLPIRVTQEMVGHYLAVFVAAESKRPVGGKYDEDQVLFVDNIRAAGGIAGFVRSWEEARALVADFYARFKKS